MAKKINLGCGKTKMEDFIGVDISCNPDIKCDIEHDKFPFRANSIEYIYSNHVLEHLRDVKHCLNECWRILKKDGIFEIKVPYGLWDGASKPTHFQSITACWFDFLRRDEIEEWYGYKVWDIVELLEIKNKKGQIYEIHCKMRPKK